ncbi:MAG TPA: N-acetylmuramoyl-L-alanine amidase [Candidatus Olsenella pullicola]|nr:N-acetylmuramoyl-L-alanine amidase [Candidatus Olsenella pullicola]
MSRTANVTRRDALLSLPVAAGLALAATGTARAAEASSPTLPSSQAIRYLYLDRSRLSLGGEQNVVVSPLEGVAPVSQVLSARLCVERAETGESVTVELARSSARALLFSFAAEGTGSHLVSSLALSLENGSSVLVDFSDCDASVRTFAVEDGAQALSEGDEVATTVTAASAAGEPEEVACVAAGVAASEAASGASSGSGAAARSLSGKGSERSTDYVVVVALDPGHSEGEGGQPTEAGSTGVDGAREEELNWKIAEACRRELETYGNVQVVMTRERFEYKTLSDRVIDAIRHNADIVVSLHLNAIGGGDSNTAANGAEVWAPYDGEYNNETHAVGEKVGREILDELEELGLFWRGVKTRTVSGEGYQYSDGSIGDYYGIIRHARRAGIPGIIVEHAFIDNRSDYESFLNSDEKLANLGIADAEGIAQAYGLKKVGADDLSPVYDESYYERAYANEVAEDELGALHHFLTVGMESGYRASSSFDPIFYKNDIGNADARALFGATMAGYYYHYLKTGVAEGRAATGTAREIATLWRLYNPYTGQHLYTADDAERNLLVYQGWTSEGVAWETPREGSEDERVFRLYNQWSGDHHYTMGSGERSQMIESGWTDEGVAWYSEGSSGAPLYRLFNPYETVGTHHYTLSGKERSQMIENGWVDESIAWYAVLTPGLDESEDGEGTPIMGESQASAALLASYYRSSVGEGTYPSSVYAEKGAASIDDFCRILVEEAKTEGVRAEVVFAQSMHETGWLRFGGAVKVEWCNFAGLGAVNSNPVDGANRFADVRTGLRAQVQHLKAYASTEDLVNECVDVRFGYVTRGCAPTLEELNGRWAVPGDGYGESIASMVDMILKTA